METLYPASHTFNSNWSMQDFQSISTNWTTEDNKKFESCLAFFDKETPDRWIKVASMIPGKTVYDVIEQYRKLVADITDIEAGVFPLPGDPQDSSFTMELAKIPEFNEFRKRPLVCRSSDQEKKKGVPWTEDEHRRFLMGLQKHGKGDWRNIARNFVITKTSTQVASHAQKYYLRQLSEGKEKRRPSIHDITTTSLTDTTPSDDYKFPTDDNPTFIPQPDKAVSMPKKVVDWNNTDDRSLMMFNSMNNNPFTLYKHETGGHVADFSSMNLGFQFQAARHEIAFPLDKLAG